MIAVSQYLLFSALFRKILQLPHFSTKFRVFSAISRILLYSEINREICGTTTDYFFDDSSNESPCWKVRTFLSRNWVRDCDPGHFGTAMRHARHANRNEGPFGTDGDEYLRRQSKSFRTISPEHSHVISYLGLVNFIDRMTISKTVNQVPDT